MPQETILKTKELEINMGPQHPSTHGVLRVKLYLDGERVQDCECIIGYLHRGVEKISENRSYIKCVPYYDRTDYIAAVSNVFGYVLGVEAMMGIDVPERAKRIRVMMTEFNRLASHLLWLATHAIDIGAMTVFLYCFREREEILKLFEALFGARLTTHAFRIGGLWKDLPNGFEMAASKFINQFPSKVDEYEQLLTENRIWIDRTQGIGVISAKEAIDYGLSGPVLRGSGVDLDLRKTRPYGGYEEFEFDVPLGKNGDTYDRYLLRLEEMRQSCRIINQALGNLPEGPIRGRVPKVVKPPVGEFYSAVEGPRGELGYYIVSDGSAMPFRVRIRPPTFISLQALRKLVRGHLMADVVAIIGTLDIVLGEIDR